MTEKRQSKKDNDMKLKIREKANHCTLHKAKTVTHFCISHDSVFCDVCLKTAHNKCDSVLPINCASVGVKTGTAHEDLILRMKSLSDVLIQRKKTYKENTLVISEQRATILMAIKQARTYIDNYLDELENSIRNNLNETYKMCRNTSAKSLESTDLNVRYINTGQELIEDMKQTGSEVDFFQILKLLHAVTVQIEMEVSKPCLTNMIEFELNKTLTNIKGVIGTFGNISVTKKEGQIPILQKFKQEQKPMNSDLPSVICIHSFYTSDIDDDDWCATIKTACFLPNENLLMSKKNEPSLFLCNIDGSGTKNIKLEYRHWDIAFVENQKAIVTLADKGFQILDLSTLTLSSIMMPNGKSCYNVTCRNGEIWVYSGDHELLNIDVNGNVICQLKTKNDPRYICLGGDGSIYYTTGYTDRSVCRIATDGMESTFFCHTDISLPRGIAIDSKGRFYVAAGESGNIVRISTDGQSHDIILRMSEDENIFLTDLLFDIDRNRLLVLTEDGDEVNIYQLR